MHGLTLCDCMAIYMPYSPSAYVLTVVASVRGLQASVLDF